MNRILLLVAMATLFFTSACQGQTSRAGNARLQKKKVLIISSSPSKGGNSDLL
jgi:lipoprotein